MQTSQISRPARTRFSTLGFNLSTVVAVVAGSAALLAGTATGSPIHPYSNPFFPGHGRHETGAAISAPRFSGFYGHHSLGKTLSRRWSATHSHHSLKAVDMLAKFRTRPANLAGPLPGLGGAGHGALGFGSFNHEEPFHCEPEPIDPGVIDPGQESEPEALLLNPSVPSAVPEPGTWILFALGIVGMLGLRGVRKSRAP